MREQPKWTPGPWELRDGQKRVIIVQAHKYIESGIYVAEVSREAWRPEDRKETAMHDARLIAEAPELYAALEDVARMFRSFPLMQKMNQEKVERIESVLAKARGQS